MALVSLSAGRSAWCGLGRLAVSAAAVLSVVGGPLSASAGVGVEERHEQAGARASAFVEDLLEKMTLEEKAGQMTQLALAAVATSAEDAGSTLAIDEAKLRDVLVNHKIGSMLNTHTAALTAERWRGLVERIQEIATEETRLGIPVVYGVDSVHGANYVVEATIFPHNLSLGATWEPAHARAAGRFTAAETRAVGLPWNFAPVADVGRTPLWSRLFETFGEDPHLGTAMTVAAVEGMQGDSLSERTSVAACLKHFLGYSDPDSGTDRTPASISASELREIFLPPFRAAMEAGAATLMINSGEINGVPVHASREILTDLLRDELGFEGVAVTDWEDVIKLRTYHRVAETDKEAAYLAVRAGIDMSMTPYTPDFAGHVVELVREGRLTEDRIDESVRRILTLKERLGLFERPALAPEIEFRSDEAVRASYEAARDSLVLLRNEGGVLPLAEDARIVVAGPAVESLPHLFGAWSYTWQGTDERLYPDSPTVLDGLRERLGSGRVSHAETLADLAEAAGRSDAVVLFLGERPSTEKVGDIESLLLPTEQVAMIETAAASGKPVIVVMVSNRPRVLLDAEGMIDGFVWAGHPGPEGPRAIAELLAGDFSPGGHLPFTYPRHLHEFMTYDHKHADAATPDFQPTGAYDPLFRFGEGLGYTSFAYDGLRVSRNGSELRVSVEVRNTGERAGDDVVQIYVTDEYASVTPRVERLRAFRRVSLDAGRRERLSFSIPLEDLRVALPSGEEVFEPGSFVVRCEGMSETIRLR